MKRKYVSKSVVVAFISFVALFAASCSETKYTNGYVNVAESNAEALDAWWPNKGSSYSYKYQELGMWVSAAPAIVTVESGVVTSAVPIKNRVVPLSLQRYHTIDELLSYVSVWASQRPDDISVKHQKSLGLPIEFKIDPKLGTFDDERGFIVSDFSFLK